jgi:hypothetical protein
MSLLWAVVHRVSCDMLEPVRQWLLASVLTNVLNFASVRLIYSDASHRSRMPFPLKSISGSQPMYHGTHNDLITQMIIQSGAEDT